MLLQIINYIEALEKCNKECGIVFGIRLGFCPLKVEITQFADGFRLNFVVVMVLLVFSLPLQKEWHLMRNFRSVYARLSLHVNFPF